MEEFNVMHNKRNNQLMIIISRRKLKLKKEQVLKKIKFFGKWKVE